LSVIACLQQLTSELLVIRELAAIEFSPISLIRS
jgi:hypothetical protein